MQTLESKAHAWLADHVPRDIQTKASNRTNTLSARMLIVECYYTAIPGPDTIGMNLKRLLTPRSEEKVLSTLHLHNIREAKISSLRHKFRNSLLLKVAVLMQNKVKVPR